MTEPIPFPKRKEEKPEYEYYSIYFNPETLEVNMPVVPDERKAGLCILAVFMKLLIESGTLNEDLIVQTALQITGRL